MIKKITILTIFLLFFYNCSQNKENNNNHISQKSTTTPKIKLAPNKTDKTYDGNVILLTQNDIDNFAKNHYTFVDGDLIIGDTSTNEYSEEIIDLSSLSSLKRINGELLITKFKNVRSSSGLENIEIINGDFAFSGCGIKEINSLKNLTTVFGSIIIGNNNFGNEKLKQISEFNKLVKVENIYISGNTSLEVLDAFNKIEEVRTIQIFSASLKKLDCFKNLKKVNKNFSIEYSWPLQSISLESLELTKGYFALNENSNYNGDINLPKIKKINHLYFMSNASLDDYCKFKNLILENKIDTLSSDGNKRDLSKNQIIQICH